MCKSITLHFPMKTTSHMILLWEIERSQTPLIKRSLHQFTSFSSPPSPTPLQNTYILSLVDPTPLSSSPKLSVNIHYWPTSVKLWLIHAHLVMAPSKGSKLLLAKEFPIIHCAMCPLIWAYQPSIPDLTLLLSIEFTIGKKRVLCEASEWGTLNYGSTTKISLESHNFFKCIILARHPIIISWNIRN